MGVQRTAGARAAAGARRKVEACGRGGDDTRVPPPLVPARARHTQHADAERETRRHTPRSGVLALAFTTYTFFSLKGEPTGKDVGRPLVDKYGAMIKDGAMAFLKEEYKWLSVFVVLLGGILCALFSVEDQHTTLDGVLTTFAFFLGAILSASAGWLGMMVATDGAISAF